MNRPVSVADGDEHVDAHAVGGVLDRGLLAQVDQRALARAVRGMAGGDDEPERRPERDHRTAAVRDHLGDRGAHAQERALEVHVEDVLPFVVGEVDQRNQALDRGRQHEDRQAADRLRDRRTALSTSARFVTSHGAATATRPVAAISIATRSAPLESMSAITTAAPSAASRCAIASPSPDAPPVTSAT